MVMKQSWFGSYVDTLDDTAKLELYRVLASGNPGAIQAEEQNKLYEDLNEISRKISPLRSQLPREYDPHGWVWLFLRK